MTTAILIIVSVGLFLQLADQVAGVVRMRWLMQQDEEAEKKRLLPRYTQQRINCWFPCAESADGAQQGALITEEEDGSLTITAREEEGDHLLVDGMASVRLGPRATEHLALSLLQGWDGCEPVKEHVEPIENDDDEEGVL